MQIDERRIGSVTVLRFGGEFDARTLPRATEAVDELFKEMRFRLVFDVGGLEVATSTAVGFFASTAKRAQNYGGKVVLSRPSRLMLNTISILKFGSLFEHFDSEEDAIAAAGGA